MPTAKRSNRSFQREITNSVMETSFGGEWQADAACSPGTAELFFPSENYRSGRRPEERIRLAKKICRDCPVIRECLNYALKYGLNETGDGIWGGMTPSERRKLKNRNNQ